MRLSRYFMPTLKETPKEAEIVSHRLMLRAGMVRQSSAGIYSWLPLGFRVLKNIERIVREEQDAAGAQEVLMPTIQPADIWKESGRYEDYGREMLRITDRHDREMLYGPTNEEQITEIFRSDVRSYRDLPRIVYHIQWKFRDEVRPRFGVMRGREFLMKDGYSFDLDYDSAKHAYNKMFVSYLKTYDRMGLKAIPMAAETGPIGGKLSHEFIILADTGESAVYYDSKFEAMNVDGLTNIDYETADLQSIVDQWTAPYAATDDMHDPATCGVAEGDLLSKRGIEVGHIFHFGRKYTEPLGVRVIGPDGQEVIPECGSYGIGVSRLVGGIIEASHDDKGIIWPESVAPFKAGILNLRHGDEACTATCDSLYAQCRKAGVEVLYDDRDERAGAKFADMDLIGLPWQILVGPRGVKNGMVELKNRATRAVEETPIDTVISRLAG